jgi:predicted signal transduction protein with EAL and GGDEF domain
VSGESHLVARLGGDEFAVLLAGERDVDATVDRLRSEIRRPVPVGGVDLSVDASLGIAVAPDDGATAPVLLRRAEVAMYDAKAGALGVARYTSSRDPYSARRLSLVTDLARSLEEGALSLHFQPQARPSDGQVVACEALLRWDHPVWGRVPPDEFVPLAERTSLMRPLTQFVVEQSIAEAVRWQRAGLPVAIAVNVSVRNVLEPDFADRIARLLVQAALPAELFKLEITETQLMEDGPRTLGTLADLVDLGIEVSIDDFGIGYSSLIRLRTLPVAEVKVDRSFVRGLPNDASDLAVVRAVVDLGHDLGLRVVAEGVETNAAWRTLDELGCDLIQGYALARPMAADDATAWLTDHFASRVARMRRQPDETTPEETRGGSAGRWLAP